MIALIDRFLILIAGLGGASVVRGLGGIGCILAHHLVCVHCGQ
jgi:hypothetical protein